MIDHKVLATLINESEIQDYYQQMFIDYDWIKAERSLHTSIAPANVRIKSFTRKEFDNYDEVVGSIRDRERKNYQQKRENIEQGV
jgi:hypothetical protein